MTLNILCSGHLVRHSLGGHSWHHLQYLVGFQRLGHQVTFFEDYGWPDSCYDPVHDVMTADPAYGIAFLRDLLHPHGLDDSWCYLAQDGRAHGMPRDRLAQVCRDCDVYFNLSNMNWIPELEYCRRRVLVDTDPVFTQIGGHGLGGAFSHHDVLFTFGERVHQTGSTMPTAGVRWLPTRQPVVADLWPVAPGNPAAPLTTVMNWSAYGDREVDGRIYGQKDREFEPFFSLPRDTGTAMQIAVGSPATGIEQRLKAGGWHLADPLTVTRTPWTYQQYLRDSRGEFCVAKHAYVSTGCGWFSERSSSYLASGRPVIVQDTGFSKFLPCGKGLLAYASPAEAVTMIQRLTDDYDGHCRAARALVEECFDARRVLGNLLEKSLQ